MCQTELISQSIVRISKRSFAHQLAVLAPHAKESKGNLTRLNNQLDTLYELLYESYPSMTETDYRIISPYLSILIATLKELFHTYQKFNDTYLEKGKEQLRRNISAIEEIDLDIRNFKINLKKNPKYQQVMNALKTL